MMLVGIGFDVHRLVKKRTLVLAGVKIPFEKGPLGHSDGDVLCHALADAILGAAACGDIGTFFPDTDPKWKDVPGLKILQDVLKIAKKKRRAVKQVDTIVIIEKPALSPFRKKIRTNLAKILKISPGMVGLKFKTAEGLGAIGQSNAIASFAVVTLE